MERVPWVWSRIAVFFKVEILPLISTKFFSDNCSRSSYLLKSPESGHMPGMGTVLAGGAAAAAVAYGAHHVASHGHGGHGPSIPGMGHYSGGGGKHGKHGGGKFKAGKHGKGGKHGKFGKHKGKGKKWKSSADIYVTFMVL